MRNKFREPVIKSAQQSENLGREALGCSRPERLAVTLENGPVLQYMGRRQVLGWLDYWEGRYECSYTRSRVCSCDIAGRRFSERRCVGVGACGVARRSSESESEGGGGGGGRGGGGGGARRYFEKRVAVGAAVGTGVVLPEPGEEVSCGRFLIAGGQ